MKKNKKRRVPMITKIRMVCVLNNLSMGFHKGSISCPKTYQEIGMPMAIKKFFQALYSFFSEVIDVTNINH